MRTSIRRGVCRSHGGSVDLIGRRGRGFLRDEFEEAADALIEAAPVDRVRERTRQVATRPADRFRPARSLASEPSGRPASRAATARSSRGERTTRPSGAFRPARRRAAAASAGLRAGAVSRPSPNRSRAVAFVARRDPDGLAGKRRPGASRRLLSAGVRPTGEPQRAGQAREGCDRASPRPRRRRTGGAPPRRSADFAPRPRRTRSAPATWARRRPPRRVRRGGRRRPSRARIGARVRRGRVGFLDAIGDREQPIPRLGSGVDRDGESSRRRTAGTSASHRGSSLAPERRTAFATPVRVSPEATERRERSNTPWAPRPRSSSAARRTSSRAGAGQPLGVELRRPARPRTSASGSEGRSRVKPAGQALSRVADHDESALPRHQGRPRFAQSIDGRLAQRRLARPVGQGHRGRESRERAVVVRDRERPAGLAVVVEIEDEIRADREPGAPRPSPG